MTHAATAARFVLSQSAQHKSKDETLIDKKQTIPTGDRWDCCVYVTVGLVFQVDDEVEFVELFLVERCRSVEHHVAAAVVLRERDAVAD